MLKAVRLGVAFTLTLFSFAALANETTPDTIAGTTKVTADEVIELVESMDDLIIIDARVSGDYAKGHIPDAINLVNTETDAEALAKVIPAKTTPVLFYCNGVKCGRSVDSAKKAVEAGYSKVYWFRGGIEEWRAKGYPEEK